MIKYIIQFLFCSVLLFDAVNAEDLESVQQRHLEMVMKCAKDNPMSAEDREKIEKFEIPDTAKCLMACIYKASEVMDNQGMLSVEGVHELARSFVAEDPERPKLAKQYTDACLSVNDMEVSDGDKGCDRAVLMFKCCMDKAPEFDYITEIVLKTVTGTQL